MDIDEYFRRVGYRGPREVSLETLRDLHRAHMYTVPFENLDIPLGRPIRLADDALYGKIVERRRGGFCYELNGLFAALLRALGFEAHMLCARVARADGSFGAPFDHMALLVRLEEPWLADVGFGDSFVEPLALRPGAAQFRWDRHCRLLEDEGELLYQSLDPAGSWKPEYRFGLSSYKYEDFAAMCLYHQTSPQSTFTQKRICSMATPEGRVTLSGNRLIVTRRGKRTERLLSDEEYGNVLLRRFGVDLEERREP